MKISKLSGRVRDANDVKMRTLVDKIPVPYGTVVSQSLSSFRPRPPYRVSIHPSIHSIP